MSDLTLGGPFSSHLVLQRDRENVVWGWDLPGQRVTIWIEAGKQRHVDVATIANSDGHWTIRLPALTAGGPYRLRVHGSSEIVLTDVLVGEVWLAAGQSNMEWKLGQANQADFEIEHANYPAIRVLKVPNFAAPTREESFEAEWQVCNPENAADFTAVGYFTARDIHQRLNVPVGIIDASWGGTYVEAWTSLTALRPVMPELPEEMAELARESTQIDRIREDYEQRLRAWERDSLPADPGNIGLLDGWASDNFNDADWKEMELPRFWQTAGLHFNGIVWFRREINLPKSWAGKELRLCLGAIDDFDQTYFNGVLVGEHPDGTPNAYSLKREYQISGSLVRPGRNVIAVRVFDHCGSGGFAGPRNALFICRCEGSTKILPLAGIWKYAVELEIPLVSMDVFRSFPAPPRSIAEQNAPAALFHGMLAPLLPYGIRGVLWYQGESNVDDYRNYRARLLALIRDIRTRFGQGTLPFLLVQLAGYRSQAAWPYLREAQAEVCAEPLVAMACAIDVGDPDDIHPRNKQAVGQRLARIALREVYGLNDVICHGPEFERIAIEGRRIRVYFRHAKGLKTSNGAEKVLGFEVAGADGRFVAADARIEGETVVVEASNVDIPLALRYAWRDYLAVNLENDAELPTVPFRTDGAGPE
jgi:sialate O-acetylesterase